MTPLLPHAAHSLASVMAENATGVRFRTEVSSLRSSLPAFSAVEIL